MGWEMIKDATRGFRESVTQGTVNAVGRVQNATGLKLGDALGWSFPKQQEQQPVREQQVVEDKVENKEEEVKKIV
jgi:organizing structure protein 2